MIKQIELFLKDPTKVNRLITICFFGFVILSGYFLATLPYDLVYKGGMVDSGTAAPVYTKLFVVVGLSFVFCYLALHYTRQAKKEVFVYLDKKAEDEKTNQATAAATHGTFNTQTLRNKINEAKSKEEKWQAGLNFVCHQLNAGQGALYILNKTKTIEMKSGFALITEEGETTPTYQLGEGLIGQAAASGKSLYLDELPEGYATRVASGLGSALPKYLLIIPFKKESEIAGVVEVATFSAPGEDLKKQAQEAVSILADI
ncbi:MAG: hypothetical protein OJF59_003245 [Cytophagales bacterium]|jgi:methyl-accepting chemotaxis protein|nr:GAF domain-containing protein [Bacteroidota bacterium]MBS1982032.1 GAF domain-containing protein [Bacteroidota bacterium]WHZ09489.1 MAG: hypothetical protein OJF59_003245 [Cytophagales bacterium]